MKLLYNSLNKVTMQWQLIGLQEKILFSEEAPDYRIVSLHTPVCHNSLHG